MTFSDGFPPFYASRPTSAFYDVTQAYLVYTAISLFIGVLIVLPGIRGKDRKYFVMRWALSLFVGTSIIACVFGLSWQEAVVDTFIPNRSQGYKISRYEVGLYVGLTSFNVTLQEIEGSKSGSHVDYNEDFHFLQTDAELKSGLKRGLPTPILTVAEFFTTDSLVAMNAWGRRYWIAGRFATYMLWASFAIWVVGNVLLSTFVKYGGLSRILGGFLMLGANVSFASVNSFCCDLEIRLGYKDPAVLQPSYGWSFWLCLCVGLISIANGTVVTSSSYFCSGWIHRFFNLEQTFEEPFVVDYDENEKSPRSSRHSSSSQTVAEEARKSKLETPHTSSSSGQTSRRTSLQKMEFIAMDTGKPSASSYGETTTANGQDEERAVQNGVTTTDL